MLILDVDAWTAAHLAVAVRTHRARLRAAWQAPPPQLADVERALASCARGGPDGTALLDRVGDVDDGVMTPLVLSVEDVARVLSLSERTVKRLVAAGQIPSVAIGSARRVSRDDLEAFVNSLRAVGNGMQR